MESATTQSFSLSPHAFRNKLREEIETICADRRWKYDDNKRRGTAFQLWTANLLRRAHPGVETDLDDAVFDTHDLQLDVVLEDTLSEKLILAQCKSSSLQKSTPPPIDDTPVEAFFPRHRNLMDRAWVRKYASEDLFNVIGDYADRFDKGRSVDYYFVSTDATSEKTQSIVEKHNAEYAAKGLSVRCILLGRQELKEFYLRIVSQEGGVGVDLDDCIPNDAHFYLSSPYPTLVAAVRADWIRNIYQKGGARERVFALNIRDWLGKRTGINKKMVETIEKDAENFFYYNNGISAICTDLDLTTEGPSVHLHAKGFQIINGAQTVGAIVDADSKSTETRVLIRITETASSKSTRKTINDNIIRFNNTQNLVKVSDFCANDPIQHWLEDALGRHKAKDHLPQITYLRRRGTSTRPRRGSEPLRLEDLGKIRYAFKHEPTTVINSPKDLFVRRSEHSDGAYEGAFGVDGKEEIEWTQAELSDCLLAIAFSLEIGKSIQSARSSDPTLKYLSQLKYFFVSLAGELCRATYDEKRVSELVNGEKPFAREFDAFWRQAAYVVKTEWKRNDKREDEGKMTLRTFARSRNVWETVRDSFRDIRASEIIPSP